MPSSASPPTAMLPTSRPRPPLNTAIPRADINWTTMIMTRTGSARVQMCSLELYPSTNCGSPLRENQFSVRRTTSTCVHASGPGHLLARD